MMDIQNKIIEVFNPEGDFKKGEVVNIIMKQSLGYKAMLLAYVRGASHHPLTSKTLSDIIEPWLDETGKSAFYRQVAQADQRFTDEIESLYASITRLVLILWGEQDEWIPIAKGRKLHRSMPSSEFITIPNAGHLVQEDAPAMVVSHILKFFIE